MIDVWILVTETFLFDYFQECKQRKQDKLPMFDFNGARRLQSLPMLRSWIPGEGQIKVENLLKQNAEKRFQGPAGQWMSFDILLGTDYTLPPLLTSYSQTLLSHVDDVIAAKKPRLDDSDAKSS